MERDEIRSAVREAFDDLMLSYSNGSVKFAESYTKAVGNLIDAFDDFVVANVVEDPRRAAGARAYVEARLAGLRHSADIISSKIVEFEKHRASVEVHLEAVSSGRPPKGR